MQKAKTHGKNQKVSILNCHFDFLSLMFKL